MKKDVRPYGAKALAVVLTASMTLGSLPVSALAEAANGGELGQEAALVESEAAGADEPGNTCAGEGSGSGEAAGSDEVAGAGSGGAAGDSSEEDPCDPDVDGSGAELAEEENGEAKSSGEEPGSEKADESSISLTSLEDEVTLLSSDVKVHAGTVSIKNVLDNFGYDYTNLFNKFYRNIQLKFEKDGSSYVTVSPEDKLGRDISKDEVSLDLDEAGSYSVSVRTGYWYFGTVRWGEYTTLGTVDAYYDVSFNAGTNGSISVGGSEVSSVKYYGDDITFTAAADDGYEIDSVLVNGNEVQLGEDGSYTLSSLSGDTAVSASFKALAFATVEAGQLNNANITVNGGASLPAKVSANHDFTIAVTPDEGYALLLDPVVAKDGETVNVAWSYEGGTATATIPDAEEGATYTVSAEATQCAFALDGNTLKYYDGMASADFKAEILEHIDYAQSVPAGMNANDISDVDYTITGGDAASIKLTYAGGDRVLSFTTELNVAVADTRAESVVALPDGTSIVYGTEDEMKQRVFDALTLTADGEDIKASTSIDDYSITLSDRSVGERAVSIKFKGNSDYKASDTTTSLAVEKGSANVSVNSQTITYGESVELGGLISAEPSDSKLISVIAGVTTSGGIYVSVDFSSITLNDVTGKTIPLVGSQSLQSFLGLDGSVSLNDVRDKVNALNNNPLLQLMGIDLSDYISALDSVISVVDSIAPGLSDAKINIGGTPSDAGAYVVAGITVNPNYRTAVGVGDLVIKPASGQVTLSWNESLGDTLDYGSTHDFTATASASGVNVSYLFVGTTSADELYSSSTAPTEPGDYVETAYVLGGNYVVEPLLRAFTIDRVSTSVVIDESSLAKTYDSTAADVKATVRDASGNEVTEGSVIYNYSNDTSTDTPFYSSSTAPTDAGTYDVIVSYLGTDGKYKPSEATAKLVISPAAVIVLPDVGLSKYVGDDDPTFTFTFESGQVYDGDDVNVTIARKEGETAGAYEYASVSATGSDARNYVFSLSDKDTLFFIDKHKVTLTAAVPSKTYDGEAVSPEYTLTGGSVDPAGVVKWVFESVDDEEWYSYEAPKDAGTYTATAFYSGDAMYGSTFVEAKFTIAKRDVTVLPTAGLTKVEGTGDPELTYTLDGLAEGESLEVALSRAAGESAGSYAYSIAYDEAEAANYNVSLSSEADEFTITAKPTDPVTPVTPSNSGSGSNANGSGSSSGAASSATAKKASSSKAVPQTGDTAPVAAMALVAGSAVCFGAASVASRRRKHGE